MVARIRFKPTSNLSVSIPNLLLLSPRYVVLWILCPTVYDNHYSLDPLAKG